MSFLEDQARTLKDWYTRLCGTAVKKRDSAELLDNIHGILENRKLLNYLATDPSVYTWKAFITHASLVAAKEITENHTAKTLRSFKRRAFDVLRAIFLFQFDQFADKPDMWVADICLSDIADILLRMVRYPAEVVGCGDISHVCDGIASESIELLCRALQMYKAVDAKPHQLRHMWSEAAGLCEKLLDAREQPAVRRVCTNVMLRVARVAHHTMYIFQCEELFKNVVVLLNKCMTSRCDKDETVTNLLNIASVLIKKFAAERRKLAIDMFLPVLRLFAGETSSVWSKNALIWQDQIFPDKKSGLFLHQEAVFGFMDSFLSLCCPDCVVEMASNTEFVRLVADSVVDATIEYITDYCAPEKAAYRKNSTLIEDEALDLIARCFTLQHLLPEPNLVKRSRRTDAFLLILDCSVVPACQVFEVTVRQWKHRFTDDFKIFLIRELIQRISRTKKEELFCWYLKCFIGISDDTIFLTLDLDSCSLLWKFVISSLHSPRTSELAARFLSLTISSFARILKVKGEVLVELLTNNISRLASCSDKAVELLAVVMSKFEFDERRSFRTSDIEFPTEWRFRCEAINFILTSTPLPLIPRKAVVQMCQYTPDYKLAKASPRDISNMEKMLMSLLHISDSKVEASGEESEGYFVLEVLESLADQLSMLWKNTEETFDESETNKRALRQAEIWNLVNSLMYEFRFAGAQEELEAITELDEECSQVIAALILHGGLSLDVVLALDVGDAWSQVHANVRNALSSCRLDCIQMCYYAMHFGREIEPKFLRQMIHDDHMCNRIYCKYALDLARDCSSFHDVAYVFERFAACSTTDQRQEFLTLLGCHDAVPTNSQSYADSLQALSSKDSEVALDKRLIADAVLTHFPENELVDHKELTCEGSPLLIALRASRKWLTENELLTILMSENLEEEIRSHLAYKILSTPSLYGIHMRALAYLIDNGTHSLYQMLKILYPQLDEVISLFSVVLADLYCRKKLSSISQEFLPHDLYNQFLRELALQQDDPRSFSSLISGDFDLLFLNHLKNLFLLDSKMLKTLFGDDSFAFSLWKLLIVSPCWFFVALRDLQCICIALHYEPIILRCLQFIVASYNTYSKVLPVVSHSLKNFISRCAISFSSSTIRSFKESGGSLEDLLTLWISLFDGLLQFDENVAQRESPVVFENFMGDDNCKGKIMSIPLVRDYMNDFSCPEFKDDLKGCVVPVTLLTERYWQRLYFALLSSENTALNDMELQRLLYLWMRYKTLRGQICKVLALSQQTSQSALFATSNISNTLEVFITVSLLEIFFDPHKVSTVGVYASICELLAIEELRGSVKDSALAHFSILTEQFLADEVPRNMSGFLYSNIRILLLEADTLKEHLLLLAAKDEVFAASLLPYLVELAFKSEFEKLKSFCASVNDLLMNNHPSLYDQSCPLITSIVACIRRLRVNIASLDFRSQFPVDLVKLSSACLQAELVDDAYFLLRCYIDQESDGVRPFAQLFRNGHGFLELLEMSSQHRSRLDTEMLFQRILVALQDADTLRAFSLRSTESLNCRMVLAQTACNWQHLAFLAGSTDEANIRSRALFYGGAPLETLDCDMQYRAAAKLAQWDVLSFPKKERSFNNGRRLYTVTFARSKQQWEMSRKAASKFVINAANSSIGLSILTQDVLKDLKETCEIEWLSTQNDRLPSDIQLRYSWVMSSFKEGTKTPINRTAPLVVAHAQTLFAMKAYQPALRLIEEFRKRVNASLEEGWECDIERARILEVCNEREAARSILTRIINNKPEDSSIKEESVELYLKAHSMLAECEMRSCRPDLAAAHLQKAVNFASSNLDSVKNVWLEKAHRDLASYAEKQYLSLEELKSSDAFKTKLNAIKKWDEELAKISKKGNMPNTKAKLLEERRIKMEKSSEENDMKQFKLDYNRQISLALKSYLFCLENGVSIDDIPYRILPILVNIKFEAPLLQIVRERFRRIASKHWVPLINHLCSHLFDASPLAPIVYEILVETACEYPFHALNHLLFYVSDGAITKPDAVARKEKVEFLIEDVCKKRADLAKLIAELQQAFNIYCEFASTDVEEYKQIGFTKRKYEMGPDSVLLREIGFLRRIPIPAISQPLSEKVEDMVTFEEVEKEITVADGLSKPCVIAVIGSDGVKRKLILKKEDLRDDSLVEQLFSVVNLLLSERSNSVPLRTYHVLPLNPSVGIIEWCLQTMSLCEYLCGFNRKSGAHLKYYPEDTTAAEARSILSKVREDGGDLSEEFENVCGQIHPVFRHFFYERFFDPLEWRMHVQNYSLSLAEWSIVGYVVGLGDRHLNNILIDLDTAQLVHIDLGMVFEFGKRNLPIPERVPFRLTRDTVDPILVEGVNGKFKATAVDVMEHLRNNSQALIGLALVLLNDPLYVFTSDGERSSQFSSLAICRLRDKLSGIENRVYMNAEQQVSHLIKEAMNADNLARMFVGWMPFL